jgi:hypothetical protein
MPTIHAGALELAWKNGNNMWQNAIEKEMRALETMDVFNVCKQVKRAPADYKQVLLLVWSAHGFADSVYVVFNTTIPSSCLKKKHYSANYDKLRELGLMAHQVMKICH